MRSRIDNISTQQEQVIKLEPLRQQKIREGLTRLLEENVGKENYDDNRLEQELIYYIEKIDISEEQVQLKGTTANTLKRSLPRRKNQKERNYLLYCRK